MNIQPLVTIGIPFYNAELYLSDAIKSVIAQTYQNWELILIDDGSIDNSLAIAQKFSEKDSRIRVISDGVNKKLPARLNQIIHEAKGEYIARMDADDLIHTERLEKQINFLRANPQFDLVSTSIISIKNNNEIIGIRTYYPREVTRKDALLGQSGIVHASILAKKTWFQRNNYNELNALAEDYELWLNAAINNDLNVGFLPEYLYYYREESNVTKEKMLKGYNTQIKIINNNYKKILTISEYKNLINKLKVKKIIVRVVDYFGIMHFLLKKRSKNKISTLVLENYEVQLKIIHNI